MSLIGQPMPEISGVSKLLWTAGHPVETPYLVGDEKRSEWVAVQVSTRISLVFGNTTVQKEGGITVTD